MDYNDIPVFVRVVETSSFTKAAESLGVQKSSVSRSIGRLESELGVRLLQRTTRNLGLTDAGQTFYERVRGALHGFDEAALTVRELGSEPRGTIRITAPPGAAAIGLADVVTSFTAQYPAITIEIVLAERTIDLVREGFDLAVRAGRLADSSLIAKKVGTTDLVLFAAPAYLDRRGRPHAPKDLEKHDCVLFRSKNGHTTWTLRKGDQETEVDVRGRVNGNEMEFALRAAVAGAGIVAVPPQLARDAVLRGELEVVLFGTTLRGSDLHVVLPSSAFVPARVMLLRDHLVRELTAISDAAHRQCREHERRGAPTAVSATRPARRRTRV
jgi:DNA-binding transcriptional LysR family regulator